MTKFVIKKENGKVTASIEHQMTKQEAIEIVKGKFGSLADNDKCRKCNITNENECANCVDEAFDMATSALEKLAEIEMCIDACENCITYQGVKEFSESEAYETIKKIVERESNNE